MEINIIALAAKYLNQEQLAALAAQLEEDRKHLFAPLNWERWFQE